MADASVPRQVPNAVIEAVDAAPASPAVSDNGSGAVGVAAASPAAPAKTAAAAKPAPRRAAPRRRATGSPAAGSADPTPAEATAAQPAPAEATAAELTPAQPAPAQPAAAEPTAAEATPAQPAAAEATAAEPAAAEAATVEPAAAAPAAPKRAAAKKAARPRRQPAQGGTASPRSATGTKAPAGATATSRASADAGAPKVRASRTRRTSTVRVLPAKARLPKAGKSVLDGLGVPVFGARHGAVESVDWSGLADEYRKGPILSFLRHRRWVYATAATDDLLIALAIVDGGVTGTAFCMITDLKTGEVIANSSRPGGPRPLVSVNDHPVQGLLATYRLPGTEYRISRPADSNETTISVRLRTTSESLPGLRWLPGISSIPVLRDLPTASTRPWLDIDLTLESSVAPALTAVSPVKADGGLVTSTVKTSAMNAWGTITLHGETTRAINVDGGTGAIDYTNGLLPRHTAWRWASATGRLTDGRLFGLNLVSEFSGIGDEANENAAWLDGALVPLHRGVRVIMDKSDLTKPWTVRTVDGSVHLQFEPVSVHREGLNLGVIRSRFVQPTGLFTGHVMVEGERIVLDRMPGVVENQDIVW